MTVESKSLKRRQYNSFSARYQTELLLIGILVVLFLFPGSISPVFLQLETLMKFLKQAFIYGTIATGMVFVIISSGIDISVSSVVGFSGVIVAMATVNGMPIPIAILLVIAFSALVGLFNGILVYDANVPPLTATLGSPTIVRNFILLITGIKTILDFLEVFTNFAADNLPEIPYLFLSWAVFVCIGLFIARKTTFGRNMYAYGSNKEVVRLNGTRVRSVVYGVCIFCSSVYGVAGILLASRPGNGVPNADMGYELDTATVAVIGGASLDGGEGSVTGAVLGAMITAILRQGGTLLGINSLTTEIIIGSLIVIAVVLDRVRKKRN